MKKPAQVIRPRFEDVRSDSQSPTNIKKQATIGSQKKAPNEIEENTHQKQKGGKGKG